MALSKQIGGIRSNLQSQQKEIPTQALQELTEVEGILYQLSRDLVDYEEERSNLLALADIGQVINSSLERDEVLCLWQSKAKVNPLKYWKGLD
jgi:hypothetical protein